MKKIFFLFCLCVSGVAVAQETIVLPSTFDENQMIVKKADKDGYFMPVNQIDVSSSGQIQAQKAQKNAIDSLPQKKNSGWVVTAKQTQKIESQSDKPKRVRRLRAIKRDYGIQKTTFSADTLGKMETPKNLTFKVPTMTKAYEDFKRESVRYEDCEADDPNCVMYEVDEAGQVISR